MPFPATVLAGPVTLAAALAVSRGTSVARRVAAYGAERLARLARLAAPRR